MIQPRTLKGFRDYLPDVMIPREQVIDTAKQVYRSYGFRPIDTPALEYLEILTGNGSDETDKQMYQFKDHGGRSVGLRFDLTIPLARFAAQHIGTLGTPFKRYHIASVWRGENTQRGRYREFMQCDFDTIGTTSVAADIETVLVVCNLFEQLGFAETDLRVNDRSILNGLLEKSGLAEQSALVLRAIDKLAKIGAEKVLAELQLSAGATAKQAEQILEFVQLKGDNESLLDQAQEFVAGSEVGEQGVARLKQIISVTNSTRSVSQLATCASRLPTKVTIDLSIARGLDYYTGIVFETFLKDLPEIGSVCSGGRYDNLAGLYTKQKLPGIGGSLGLDRLLAAMEQLNMLNECTPAADVFIPWFAADKLPETMQLAEQLRQAGIRCEVYPEAKKLGKQLQYANRRGYRAALILGEEEISSGTCQLKNMEKGESSTISTADGPGLLVRAIEELISEGESA